MSKVLVDRELLERCVDRWACCAIVETPGAEQAWLELRAAVKAAQPAEAEGVEVVAWLLEGGRFYKHSVVTTEAEADRRIAERRDQTVKSALVRLSAISTPPATDALVEALERIARCDNWGIRRIANDALETYRASQRKESTCR